MKATLFGLVALAVGVGIGSYLTSREFANDVVPLDLTSDSGKKPGEKIGPKAVVIGGERHDFGSMDRTEHRSHSFIVRNDGDAPLTLSAGEPSCSACIKVFKVDRDQLQPGEKTNVTFEWEAKVGETQFEQSGPLKTNDRRRPTIQLTISGQIIDTVRAERTDIHFHDISANEPAAVSINIYSFRSADLTVEKFDMTDANLAPYFHVSFSPLDSEEVAKERAAKGGVKMTIEIKPGMRLGRFEQAILVTTNQNAPAAVTIRVLGNVISDIYLAAGQMVVPDKMLVGLGSVPRSEGAKRTFYLLVKGPYRDQTELRVDSLEPAEEFSATLGEPNRDNPKIVRYPLTIEVLPGKIPVNRNSEGTYAQVRLTSTHPDVKELVVKVRYVVKE